MRILAIDDEFAALKKMELLLSEYGSCDAATNGQQARELYVQAIKNGNPYGLITLDIELPDANGIELLKYFSAIEGKSEKLASKKLIITAHGNPDNVMDASKYCDGFITKPVKRDLFTEKLNTLGIEPTPSTGQQD